MKDYLLQHDGRYVECEIDGLRLIYTCSDEPKCHYEETLRDHDSYNKLKNTIQKIYESHDDTGDAYWDICEFLHSSDSDEYFTGENRMLHQDLREVDEICKYEKEAFDKVWLMRSRPVNVPEPNHPNHSLMSKIEHDRQAAVERIFNTYTDIPEDGYTDWECGYWNGIMGALRWVMGDEKDFLDT